MAIFLENSVTIFLFLLFYSSFFSLVPHNQAADRNRITKGESIKDGDFLVSEDGTYEIGFFSPENSECRYVGIRYHGLQDPAVIWVANRNTSIPDRNGSLKIDEDGNLLISDGNGNFVWSSNTSISSSITTVAILAKTGNLILSSNDSIGDINKAYWQSFDYPTDTFLPTMKVKLLDGGENHALTSWTSPSDPSPGSFSIGTDARGAPQLVMWNQSDRLWRSGHWDNQIFIGVPSMADATTYQYGFKVSSDEGTNKLFVTYNPSNLGGLLRFRINHNGSEDQLKWDESANKWIALQREPSNDCEIYNYCGNFGVCKAKTVKCRCLKGFRPRYPEKWNKGDFSDGCERSSTLQCQRTASNPEGKNDGPDGFKSIKSVKLPDFAEVLPDPKATTESCRDTCTRNCSCNAYARVDGIGCMTWYGDLVDVQQFDRAGKTMFLRLPHSELGGRLSTPVIVSIIVAGLLFLTIIIWLLWTLKTKSKALHPSTSVSRSRKSEMSVSELSMAKEFSTDLSGASELHIERNPISGQELAVFNFATVAAATNNFSAENMIGQGGFGPVYKGKLPGGEEIAVKRLSKISGQGMEEFKNEVIVIARLQHRNLVRILGYCIEGEEKLLLYEYMLNRSLDSFIFDPLKRSLLDWSRRCNIIEGIARGLVYLHRDSRLRIIHRDLKAGNILLDGEMNPKISDFGMARIFGGNQNEANTNRVVGTLGYMSPEYAMEGLISVKSDVYSFGVLVLEIVSGRKNTSFRSSDYVNLIAYAWELWNEDKVMEIVDPSIRDSCEENEVLRCVQVAMLCVQDSAGHRPSMDSVVLMLETENTILSLPRQPTFTSMTASADTEAYTDGQETASSNNVTVTVVAGR